MIERRELKMGRAPSDFMYTGEQASLPLGHLGAHHPGHSDRGKEGTCRSLDRVSRTRPLSKSRDMIWGSGRVGDGTKGWGGPRRFRCGYFGDGSEPLCLKLSRWSLDPSQSFFSFSGSRSSKELNYRVLE